MMSHWHRRVIEGAEIWIVAITEKSWLLTTNSKFSTLCYSAASMWHPNAFCISKQVLVSGSIIPSISQMILHALAFGFEHSKILLGSRRLFFQIGLQIVITRNGIKICLFLIKVQLGYVSGGICLRHIRRQVTSENFCTGNTGS